MNTNAASPYRVLFVGYLFPQHLESSLYSQPIPPVQTQRFGQALAYALIAGFGENVEIVSVAPLRNFPRAKFLLAPGAGWVFAGSVQATLVPFVNLIGLRHLTRFFATLAHVVPWMMKTRSSKRVILMHSVQSCKIWAVLLSSLLAPATTIAFLTDDLGIPRRGECGLTKKLRQIDVLLIKAGLRRISGVIAMTPHLADKLSPERPRLIIPAIHNPLASLAAETVSGRGRVFTIGYFGVLSHDYGVDMLLSAFELADRADWRLVITGAGELQEAVRRFAARDPRLEYHGFVNDEGLARLYQSVDVFVNPKPTSTPLASLAFPSKLVEYLGTGKPVISTDLPALDKGFRSHLVLARSDTPQELIRCFVQVSSWGDDQYAAWRAESLRFVRDELSPSAQGTKIRRFVDHLSKPWT